VNISDFQPHSQKMNAFVMLGIGETGYVQKPIPEPGPNDAVVKTTAALVCTSDCHVVNGSIGEQVNLTLGHEAAGIVYRIGSAVRTVKEGDRVTVNAITPCFRCHACQRGYTSQCGGLIGGWKLSNVKDGVFADYFHVNDADANLVPIPDSLSDEAACYTTDMMSTGFKGAEEARIPIGGSVAILGQGPVGLMATAGARLVGAGLVIAVDKRPNRLKLSKFYGADVALNFTEVDPDEEIMDRTAGIGVDAAIEAIGSQMAFDSCIRVTRPGGVIVNLGIHSDGDTVDILRSSWGMGMKEQTIRSVLCPGGRERMTRLMKLIENQRVDPTKLTTHRFNFELLHEAFELMRTKEDNIIKPLILF
jgi:threonine dehydrogenase-like Zn-dependent dehydrogenase